MEPEIKTSCGLYLDMDTVRQMSDKTKLVGAEKHEDIVIVNGDRRVSMTVDEFIEKIGA